MIPSHENALFQDTVSAERKMREAIVRKVAIFRKDLLPVSETFISGQFAAYRRWSPTLVGYRRVDGQDLSDLPHRTLFDPAHAADRVRLKVDQFSALVGRQSHRLANVLTDLAPNLVHAHFGYDAVLAASTAFGLGLPLVVTLHGTDILREWSAWESGDMGLFFRFYPRAIRRLFADPKVHFIAVSDALRTQAICRGVPQERLTVAYTGIDTSRFDVIVAPSDPTSPLILFIGRLVPFKGCEYLIHAMSIVRQRFPGSRLVIAGDGPLRPKLVALSGDLGVNATFTGSVDATLVRDLLTQATLFCLPSVTEPDGSSEAFGTVMLEAQAVGVPVLTSARAGAEAILPGATGELFPERDVASLSASIIGLLEDTDRRRRFSSAARAHVRDKFDIAPCTGRIEALYDRAIIMSGG